MSMVQYLNKELIDKLSFEEYVDLFTTMLKTLSERSLYFAENREH